MKFRWKLLLLLLCMTLVPMLVMRFTGTRAFQHSADNILSESRTRTMQSAERYMRILVDGLSGITGLRRELVEATVAMQAWGFSEMVSGEPFKPSALGKMLLANNKVVSYPSVYERRQRNHNSYFPVDFDKVAIHTPQAATSESDVAKIVTLQGQKDLYKIIRKRYEGSILWQVTTLSCGAHFFYPGVDRIPFGLDFRKSDWYRRVMDGETVWSLPFVDPLTRQVVLSVSWPLEQRREGNDKRTIVGVTSLFLPLVDVLQNSDIAERVPDGVNIYLAYPDTQRYGEDGIWRLRVFASKDMLQTSTRRWRTGLDPVWLESDDQAEMRKMVSKLMEEKSGTEIMDYHDEQAYWAYGPTGAGGAVIAVAPWSEITAAIREQEGTMKKTLEGQFMIMQVLFIIVLALVTIASLLFSGTVTRPLDKLMAAVRRLGQGDLDARVELSSRDEFGVMAKVFNEMAPRLKDYLRLSGSIAVAEQIQRNLLPQKAPELCDLDVHGASVYSEATGGDYYDYIKPDCSNCISIVVGDVTGHGLEAALLMTSARAAIRQRSAMPGCPADILTDVNREMSSDVYESGRFMTVFMVDFSPEESMVRWVRGGHDPALIYSVEQDSFRELMGNGVPLGVIEDFEYTLNEGMFEKGEILAIGTDGIWEAHSPEGEMFGKERMREIIRETADKPAREIVESVIREVAAFCGLQGPEDDVTLVVIKFNSADETVR